MSADAIDAKAPWDWVFVWVAIRSDTAQTMRNYLADESTARARRVRRALRDMRRTRWWTTDNTQIDAGVTIGANFWELWHGPLDSDHVPWLATNVPNCRIIRCWWPSGQEVGGGAPTYRELTSAQETALKNTWVTATGRSLPMWWPGRLCGMPPMELA